MKIEIFFPDPKLKPGDVITDGHCRYGVCGMLLTVPKHRLYTDDPEDFVEQVVPLASAYTADLRYDCAIQEGSVQRGNWPEGHVRQPVRPGLGISLSAEDAEAMVRVPDFDPARFVRQDTMDNIDERELAWDARETTQVAR